MFADFKNHFKVYEPLVSDKYEKWLKLSDIEHAKPTGFLVQLSFFVQGSSNAHIVFSPIENPSPLDNAYEVEIGGFGNTRIMIRKRTNGVLLADAIIPNILNVLKKKQFVFEVSMDGEIKLYGEDQLRPLLVAFDPQPLTIAYISFKNVNDGKLCFFYGYNPEQLPNVILPIAESTTKRPLLSGLGFRPIFPQVDILNVRKNIRENYLSNIFASKKDIEPVEPVQIIGTVGIKDPKAVKYEPVVMHPFFENILPTDVDQSVLVKNSQYIESWNNDVHKPLVNVTSNMRSAGYILRFPFYVRGPRAAYVRLWPTDNSAVDQDYYEIQMGTAGNSVARILRKGQVLAEIVEENLLEEWQLIKMVIEVTSSGVINLYTAHNRWAPLLTAVDPNPINIEYISFGSDTRVQFFYDVNEKNWFQALPITQREQHEHPLLSAVKIPIGYDNEWLEKYFKVIVPSESESTIPSEQRLINLDDLKMVKSDGYKVRMPMFINGSQNARILLASKSSFDISDDAYVIDIGSSMNSRIQILKRLNGPILAKAIVPNVLSNVKPKFFVIEVSEEGWIRVFSEDDHVNPLISTIDPYPIDVNYVGFTNYRDEPVQFYYDYESDSGVEHLLNKMVPFKYSLADLTKQCKEYVSETSKFRKFMRISNLDHVQARQLVKTFSFFVDGSKDISILLADSITPKPEVDFVYEIREYFILRNFCIASEFT